MEQNEKIKQNNTLAFLTRISYYLSQLDKEAQRLSASSDLRLHAKRFFNVFYAKLKPAYDEMRKNLCNLIEDNDDQDVDDDDDYDQDDDNKDTDYVSAIEHSSSPPLSSASSENLIDNMYQLEKSRRRIRIITARRRTTTNISSSPSSSSNHLRHHTNKKRRMIRKICN
jgi:hypothetical protein